MAHASASLKVRRREESQEAIRLKLSTQSHLNDVIDITNKISNPEETIEGDMLRRYEIVLNTKLRLINKFLPDLKAVDLQIGGEVTQHVISAEPIDAEQWERVYSVEAAEGATESVN